MPQKRFDPPRIEPREFRSPEEIDSSIAKLNRRIEQLNKVDIQEAVINHTGEDQVATSDIRESILEIFGLNSPEFREPQHIEIWDGPLYMGMSDGAIISAMELGRRKTVAILKGLIGRVEEKRADLVGGTSPATSTYFDHLNLHPRILDVSRDLFLDGHPWDAVFAASKALINYVKDRSNRHDLDGAPLVGTVFSKNDPILAFNDLADATQLDEQEGTMHLFEGAVLAIRNQGGHSFPEGSDQRAIEYISFLSLLAYRVQEAKVRRKTL